MQDVINDPIRILQSIITDQVALGYTFEGTVLNIATKASVNLHTQCEWTSDRLTGNCQLGGRCGRDREHPLS